MDVVQLMRDVHALCMEAKNAKARSAQASGLDAPNTAEASSWTSDTR